MASKARDNAERDDGMASKARDNAVRDDGRASKARDNAERDDGMRQRQGTTLCAMTACVKDKGQRCAR
ncbi:hypothetical protein chiPu_0021126 [Chiloscyllium punctatum]|uniref:Uncharacterized protein n=1 Tax=Chiloscyllium punctatum TaxID=137246 RepID=A0A401RNM0_CHIPU|nr:hypothetical protein [Chiloscyllium punctatum]